MADLNDTKQAPKSEGKYVCESTPDGTVTISGVVTMNEARTFRYINKYRHNPYCTVDLSKGQFIEEEGEEVRETFRGFSHSGGVYSGRLVKAKFDSLQIALEELKAGVVILPSSAKRKHLNTCIKNESVAYIVVSDDSKLFSMKGDDIWNKKGTILIREQSARPTHGKCADCGTPVSSAFTLKNADNEPVCKDCEDKHKYINIFNILYKRDDPRFIEARDHAREVYKAIRARNKQ